MLTELPLSSPIRKVATITHKAGNTFLCSPPQTPITKLLCNANIHGSTQSKVSSFPKETQVLPSMICSRELQKDDLSLIVSIGPATQLSCLSTTFIDTSTVSLSTSQDKYATYQASGSYEAPVTIPTKINNQSFPSTSQQIMKCLSNLQQNMEDVKASKVSAK